MSMRNRRSRHVTLSFLLPLLAAITPAISHAQSAVHRDPAFTEHGLKFASGLHVGYPSVVSAGVGALLGLGDHSKGALIGLVEPGLLARRYTAGIRFWQDFYGTGAGLRATKLQPWTTAPGMPRNSSFLGGELLLHAMHYGVRAGAFRGQVPGGPQMRMATLDFAYGM